MPAKSKSGERSGLAEAPPHYLGHRDRLRTRFREAGAEALSDYEMLELVLFRALPRRDVKPLAKALIAKFGSFAEVIAAPENRLREVKGLGEQATVDLKGNNDAHIRLKTLGPGAIVGEVAFYLGGPRTASVIARTKVAAWQFTQTGLRKVQAEAPDLAVAFHKGMASILAGRLSSTNRLVQFLMN